MAVRSYLHFVEPALLSWAADYENLRQVQREDVQAAIAAHQGRSQHNVHSALRSLFRGLKRERRVFHDRARGVPGRYANALPRSLPAERLCGLLDRCDDPRHRLTIALVAVHALSVEELIQLRLADYDPARTVLAIRRGTRVFIVVLDPVVAGALVTWLRTRVARWPRTGNPHLFVTDCTALNETPISRYGITAPFRLLKVTARQLRVDRILDEAGHAGDPVQLMRVFGLGVGAAVRYVRAAHPEKFRRDPTSP